MATILVIGEHSHQRVCPSGHSSCPVGQAVGGHTRLFPRGQPLCGIHSQQAVCKGPPSVTSCDACSFSVHFISFTSLLSISLAHQTLLRTRCLVTIFTFFLCWSHRCNKSLSQPLFKSSSYLSHLIGPRLAGPVCFVAPYPGTCFLHTCDI